MEIDEMKKLWAGLESRLEQNGNAGKRLITEMLRGKATRMVGNLLGYDILGVVVVMAALPVLLLRYPFVAHSIYLDILLWYLAALTPLLLALQIYKLVLLGRIDFTAAVGSNIRTLEKYNILLCREKIYGYPVAGILAILIVLVFMHIKNVEAWRLAVIGGMFVIVAVSYPHIYKKLAYRARSARESFEELADLE